MFKKILILILVLFFFNGFNLNVKAIDDVFEGDIISEIGIGKDSMIFTEGVSEISGKVNWNEPGTYEVLCTKENKEYFVRNVIVKSEESLFSGIDIVKEIGSYDFFKNNVKEIVSSNVFVINRNEYFAYYNCLSKNDNKISFVCKYKKSEASIVYSLEGYSSIGGMTLYENSLYVLASIYENGLGKIQIFKFDRNLNLISANRYYSNKDDLGKAIYSHNNYLYLFIEATSNEGIIERSASNKIILILKINPYNYMIEKYLEIGNNYDNQLLNVEYSNNKFILYSALNGSSGKYYHSINKSYTGGFILGLDEDFSVNVYKFMENDIEKCVNVKFDDKVNLNVWKENLNKIIIKYGEYNKEITRSIDSFKDEISAVSSIIYKDNIYIFVSLDNKLSKLILINDEDISVKNLELFPYNCTEAYCFDGEIYLQMKGLTTRLFVYNNLKIKKVYEKINANNLEIISQKTEIYINDAFVNSENKYQEINQNYGTYISLSSERSDNYLLLCKNKYSIPLVCNVRDGECYDPGLVLNFNGQATLNNVNIFSGYKLDEIGKYQLDISGENSSVVRISFEISDVISKDMTIDKQIDLIFEYGGYEKSSEKNFEYEINKKNDYQSFNELNYIAYTIFAMIVIYVIYYFIFKNKKEKK